MNWVQLLNLEYEHQSYPALLFLLEQRFLSLTKVVMNFGEK